MGYRASMVFPGAQPGQGTIRVPNKRPPGFAAQPLNNADRWSAPQDDKEERFTTTYNATLLNPHKTVRKPTSNSLRLAGQTASLSMRHMPTPLRSATDLDITDASRSAPPGPAVIGMAKSASAPGLQIQGFGNASATEGAVPSSRPPSESLSSSATRTLGDPRDMATLREDRMRTVGSVKARRRNMLETLADPNVQKRARDFFRKHDADRSGKLEVPEIIAVMKDLEHEHGIPTPQPKVFERLVKKYDTDNDSCLTFDEFYEMWISALRIQAFQASTVYNREFFVTKQIGNVWQRYSKVKELGAGTFGTAYLAKSKATQEHRVIKAVRKGRAKIPIEEIEKEILLMRQVDHPHIVRLFEWFEDKGRIYLVLEALEGGTLQKIVLDFAKKRKALKEEWIRSVTRQSIEAMAYVHSLRLIHKDIKDENIMLLKKDPEFNEPFVVIIDLGVSEMFSVADPACHEIGGTPATMAPEVWKGNFGPKCDVWSLGCVLFEMLAGAMPYMTSTIQPEAWLKLHRRGPDWRLCKSSDMSINLCKDMLTYAEAARPNMVDCLQHEWFVVDRATLSNISPSDFTPLREFVHESKLKKNILLQVASRLPMGRAVEINRLFENVDQNRDGSLSYEEMKDCFEQMGIEPQTYDAIWNSLDADGDGSLSFTEFTTAMLFLCRDILEERLLAMFAEYDVDSSGFLDRDEAKEFLANATAMLKDEDRPQVQSLLRGLLPSRGNHITFETLRDILLPPIRDEERAANSRLSSARLSSARSQISFH